MLRPPLSKEKRKIFLALDIGTEAIKSLIFQREKGENTILGADLKDNHSLGIIDGENLETEIMAEAISETIKQSKKKARVEIKNYLTFGRFSGNILKERVAFDHFQRDYPEKVISGREEDEIYRKVIDKAKEKISKEFFEKSGILTQDLYYLDSEILERKINGYRVDKLEGVSGKDLEFKILFLFVPKDYLNNIEKIAKKINLNNLKLASESKNLITAFYDQKITAIFLDIGGRLTQIFLMKEGNIQALDGFDIGGDFFSQRLSQTLGIDKSQAEDLKIRYAKGDLSEDVRKKIRDMLFSSTQVWLEKLKAKLRKISEEEGLLPPTIFLFGGGSLLPEIREISIGDNREDLPFLSKPQINPLSLKYLKNIKDKTNIVNTSQYIPTLLLCYTNA